MAKIIGVIQVKGGAGRSTIATNLAGAISTGARVALIDCDMPQATSAAWGSIRQQGQLDVSNLTTLVAYNHRELVSLVEEASQVNDFVVIDGPPRIAEITRAMLMLSDVCLIPLGASAPEIWATSDLIPTIDEARAAGKEIGKKIDPRIVWNKYRASTTSAKEMPAAVKTELGLSALEAKLGYRVAFSDALARGVTVLEWTDHAARDEMEQLCREVGKIIKARLI